MEQRREDLTTADLAAAGNAQRNEGPEERRPPMPGQQAQQAQPAPSSAEPIPITSRRGPTPAQPPTQPGQERPASLFSQGDTEQLRSAWQDIQAGFVDNPRETVERADKLVAAVIKELADGFAKERSNLEGQWSKGQDVDTEDLRRALQRYRSFFDRLLSI